MTHFRPSRRAALLGAAALAALTGAAQAADCPEGFPEKPITFIIGFGAGGGTDAIGRSIAAAIEQQQGWDIVVENRPGASGGVMAAGLKEMAPDGYTIGMAGTDTVTVNPYETASSPYTYEDFDYLGSAMQINFGLVALEEKPYDTLEEFIEWAREQGRATVSVAGVSQTVAVRQMAEHFDVNLVPVPGKGAADALQQALGGHVDATTQGSQHVQQIKAGNMVQLASLIGKRVPYAPDSKTLKESGLDVSLEAHTTFLVPKGMEEEIKTCLAGAIDEATRSEGYADLMEKFQNEALNLGPEGVEEVVARMAAFYRDALSD